MEKYPNIDKKKMGFGKGFEKRPAWNYASMPQKQSL